MARYAIIAGGQVRNVVEADAAWIAAHAPGAVLLDAQSAVGPGWAYGNGVFSPPAPAPAPVPSSVTRRQARQALLLNGISLAAVDAVIAALPEPQRALASIFWQDSNDFLRANPTLQQLATALGLSPQQVDLLFIQASTL